MTEDDVTRGATQVNILSGAPFDAVGPPTSIESLVGCLPTGEGGTEQTWKLNHYYERLDDWYAAQGVAPNPFLGPAAVPSYELHTSPWIPRTGTTGHPMNPECSRRCVRSWIRRGMPSG